MAIVMTNYTTPTLGINKLSPSLPPTPPSSRRGTLLLGKPTGRATLALPSNSSENDASRVKNCGRPTRSQTPVALTSELARDFGLNVSQKLLRVSSAPILTLQPSEISSPMFTHSLSSSDLSLQTPRMARGLVRKASKVPLSYPDLPATPKQKPLVASPKSTNVMTSSSSSLPRKRVAWSDFPLNAEEEMIRMEKRTQLTSHFTLEDGTNTFQLHRSMRLCDCLWDLRRAVSQSPSPEGTPVANGHAQSENVELEGALAQELVDAPASVALVDRGEEENDAGESLLNATLRNCCDTVDELRKFEDIVDSGLTDASDAGGARHATSVICGRALAAIRRKIFLLESVETRLRAMMVVHENREEVLESVVQNTKPVPPELCKVKKFIAAHTHKAGNPGDANKTDFASFVATFKLSAKHELLRKFREEAYEIGEWWAEACLAMAEKGHGHAVLLRLFEVALGTGVERDHFKLVRAWKIINDRLADRILREAKERQAADEAMAKRHELAPVGPATEKAEEIEKDILGAIKDGVDASDARLREAEAIAKKLLYIDGERKRLVGRAKRLEAARGAAQAR